MATPATPQPQTLAQSVRAKYPGAYDDMSDVDLEQKIVSKYPQYADMPRTPRMPTPDAQISPAPKGILPWLQSAENDVRYGSENTGFGHFLRMIGMQATNNGVPANVGESMGGQIIGPLRVAEGAADMPSHPGRGLKTLASGAVQTISPALNFVAPEAGPIEGAMVKGAARVGEVAEGAKDVNNLFARMMRYPASARQSQLGRPGTVKNMLPSFLQKYTVPESIIPKGDLGTMTNPGPYAEIPVKVKPPVSAAPVDNAANVTKKTLDQAYTGERTGLPYQPNPRYTAPITPAAPIPARTGLMLPSAPAEVTQAAKPAVSMFPRPLRPLVGTPEEFAAYDQQMKLLKGEASDAGTYSAARGKVGKKLTYQQRIGQKVNP